jgi:hypothetical protein
MSELCNKILFVCFCVFACIPLAALFLFSFLLYLLVELTGALMRGNPQSKRRARASIKTLANSFRKSWLDE